MGNFHIKLGGFGLSVNTKHVLTSGDIMSLD
jgi:hypothetical protein